MTSAIIDGTNIDLSILKYTSPKPNAAGGKVVNLLNRNYNESLTIAVPLMGSWGAQEVKEVVGKGADGKPITKGTGKYTMTLQFSKGSYTTPEADQFLEQMKLLEQQIKNDAMNNSKEWFGKEIKSMEVMDEKISPMLKYPKVKGSEERNLQESPQLNVKLPCWKDVWQTSVFDEDGNPLYIKGKSEPGVTPLDFLVNSIKAPMQVICLIQCAGLWFVGSPAKVSITWNLKQVVVKKPKTSSISDDTCFLTVRPGERELLKSQPDLELQHVDTVSAYVADSDGEDDLLPVAKLSISEPVIATPVPVPEPTPVPEAVSVPEPVVETAAPAEKVKRIIKKTKAKE